jgi:hypothetical protein
MISDELLQAKFEEARRLVATAPAAPADRMSLIDALIAVARLEKSLQQNMQTLNEMRRLGALTRLDVDQYNKQCSRVYRVAMGLYVTTAQFVADALPGVDPADVASVLPIPAPPPLLPYPGVSSTGTMRGLGNPAVAPAAVVVAPVAAAGGVAATAAGWAVAIIAGLLVLAVVAGVVYIVSSQARQIIGYQQELDAKERGDRLRVAAAQACIASGQSAEACQRLAEQNVPPPPTPPKAEDAERIASYIVWGMLGLAGLSVIPLVTNAFSALGSLGGERPRSRRSGIVVRPEDDYE